ncbi:MAG: tetratricopeptide repeat protein [Planctomycetota bacterium]|jgi:tetratricopeptide (TPR) repeat protein|nr:hypothetical protein [Planctomycetota bacterium]MDP6369381.1 tetratricopeptide repeat protein [Planctomycetota bacterium]MDP6837595.1 tetratricopeptide repeat protein [Planctomycetota bacterium]
MLRLVGFFLITLVALQVLRQIPVLGAIFEIPFLGFWGAAILVSMAFSAGARAAVDGRRRRSLQRSFGALDLPNNRGKLGCLLLSQGRAGKALGHLQAAVDGEREVTEWSYRLGLAQLRLRNVAGARESLERAAAMDEEHGYGGVLLALAHARRRGGDAAGALTALERFERNHGPKPESAFRRGRALAALGRRDEAALAYGSVAELATAATKYQQREARLWQLRAALARVGF